jgi:hypothetical protein
MRTGGHHGQRVAALFGATAAALWLAAGPASALTVPIALPPLPAPLSPLQPPVSGTVSVGDNPQAPISVGVTAPALPPVQVTVPGVTSISTDPAPLPLPLPGPSPVPIPGLPVPTPVGSLPSAGSPLPGSSTGPGAGASTLPAPGSSSGAAATGSTGTPASAWAPVVTATDGAPIADVRAAITHEPPSSFLSALPSIAARVLPWAALVQLAIGLRYFVASGLAARRRKPRVA